MPKVNIYKLNNEGKQILLVTCELVAGSVIITGDDNFANNLRKTGVRSYTDASSITLFPSDGLSFLKQLKYNFKSGYLMATDVLES